MATESSVKAVVTAASAASTTTLSSHIGEKTPLKHTRQSGVAAAAAASRGAVLPSFPTTLQFRIFKRKKVILVLLWSLCSNSVLQFFFSGVAEGSYHPVVALSILVFPLLGWLADVYLTRYRVIKWCLRIMWLVSVLFCLLSVLLDYYDVPTSVLANTALKCAVYLPFVIGLGGFFDNIIQLGIDQMVDASSSEISSLLSWYAWVWSFCGVLMMPVLHCVCTDHFESILLFIFSLLFTIAISLDYIFHSCLVKEPPSSNPLTLIFKVLRYAAKNKYPRLCSAFTYWDDKRLSRIDLGKSKYGGPFTTEEVEDVKTFWRMFGIIVVGALSWSLFISTYPVSNRVFDHLQRDGETTYRYSFEISCFQRGFYQNFGNFILVIFVPVYEFILHPFFRKYFHVSITVKFVTGIIFVILNLIGYLSIEGIGRHLVQDVHYYNFTCPKDGIQDLSLTLPLNQMWVMFPGVFDGMAHYFCLTSATEFICAQSPYSMKGLMFGVTYGCIAVFTVLSYALLLPVQYGIEKWSPPRYGCEMWYLLFVLSFLFVIFVISCCVYKSYKKRFRDDNLHNEQMFAINYYSQDET